MSYPLMSLLLGSGILVSVGKYLVNRIKVCLPLGVGFPHRSDGKEAACSAGDPGLIPRSGRSSGEGRGNPL